MFVVFRKLRGDQAILQKLTFVLANMVGIGLAVWKFNRMGLLPTSPADWLEFIEARQVSLTSQITYMKRFKVSPFLCQNLEVSGGGMVLT